MWPLAAATRRALPLSVQPALLDALDAQNTLGITLTPQLWMVPQKSVTALMGLKETDNL